jgi:hypothetical protein
MTYRTAQRQKSRFASRGPVLSASVVLASMATPALVCGQDKGPYFAVGPSP